MKIIAKHSLKAIVLATLSVMVTLQVSCSGEDGQDGIDGVDGAIGPEGPAGPAGQDGQDGNANVIASDWFELRYDDMSRSNPPTWGAMILENEEIPELNLENFVDDGGVLLVYVKIYEGPPEETDYIIISTPSTFGSLTFVSGFQQFGSELGVIIRVKAPDISILENTPNLTLRYILVPGSTVQSFNLDEGGVPATFDEATELFGLEK